MVSTVWPKWQVSVRLLLSLFCFCSVFCGFFFNVLATSKIKSRCVPTYDSVHSWLLYSAVPLGGQATSSMTWYPTQPHFTDTEPTCPRPILIMLNAWLRSDKYRFESHRFNSTSVRTLDVWNPLVSQNGRRMLNSFGHPVWFVPLGH